MFVDMVGYSAMAQADERRALELLDQQRELLGPIIDRHNGHLIKTIGDGLLAEFASAVEAAECAIEMQGKLVERNQGLEVHRRFEIRIGLHVGDIVVREGDVLGDGVNVASRIEACAPPGGIAVSEAVAHQVENKLDFPVVFIGSRKLKNIRKPVTLYRIAVPWDQKAVAAQRRSGRWWSRIDLVRTALGAAALLSIGSLAWWLLQPGPASVGTANISSLAILPLDNLSRDPGEEYLVEGLHDALISNLAQIGALRVISRTSMAEYKETEKSIPEIGRELKVDAIVEGSVLRAGNRIRITAQLISVASDQLLWSRSYEHQMADILTLQGEVAREIADEIRIKLTPRERNRLASTRAVVPEAHEAYLRGRWYRDKGTPEDLQKAFEYFEKALQADPNYAPAHTGMATYYSILPFYSDRSPVELLPRARAAVLRALELDDLLPEAHAALAYIRAYYEWDWEAAERSFQTAIDLSPNYADAHFSYSRFLAAQKRFVEAEAEIRRAHELDPLSLLLKTNIALLHYFAGQYDQALMELEATLEIDPEFTVALWGTGLVYEQKGRYGEAIRVMEQVAGESPNRKSSLGHLYAVAGRREEAQSVLEELSGRAEEAYVPSYFFALICAGLGEKDQAFEWLEKAYQERSSVLAYLQVDPRIANLRDDPRYETLVRRLRFPRTVHSRRGASPESDSRALATVSLSHE